MKIALVSDIHLEFSEYNYDFNQLEVDLIIFAGDILPIARGNVVSWIKRKVKSTSVIFVPGNHDYYGGIVHEAEKAWKEEANNSHIHVLIEDKIELNGITFLGTPMFSNLSLPSKWPIPILEGILPQSMADFSQIRKHGFKHWSVMDMIQRSNDCLSFLNKNLPKKQNLNNNNTYVVVTHWAPSEGSISPQFANDPFNTYFVLDTGDLVERSNLWLHGHTHSDCDYRVGNNKMFGRVINHPRGYVDKAGRQEIPGKYCPKIIEI